MPRTFRSVGVVGLGTMGAGIVQVFARAGLTVAGVEPTGGAPLLQQLVTAGCLGPKAGRGLREHPDP